jgi:septum formation protein
VRRVRIFSEATHVKFRTLGPGQIADYLSRVHVLDKAGAYALQEHGDRIVERVEGSASNVIGLPLEMLSAALERWHRPDQAG